MCPFQWACAGCQSRRYDLSLNATHTHTEVSKNLIILKSTKQQVPSIHRASPANTFQTKSDKNDTTLLTVFLTYQWSCIYLPIHPGSIPAFWKSVIGLQSNRFHWCILSHQASSAELHVCQGRMHVAMWHHFLISVVAWSRSTAAMGGALLMHLESHTHTYIYICIMYCMYYILYVWLITYS